MAKNKTDGQILKGLLDTLVLDILSEKDNYGFGIMQRFQEKVSDDNDVLLESTLYPLLHRLESKGYVDSYMVPGERGTPRKYYRITDPGKVHRKERKDEWQKIVSVLRKTILRERKK